MLSGSISSTRALAFANWLVGPARTTLTPVEIVEQSCERLLAAGAPLWQVRIGQRLANPLIGAWGVLWKRGSGAEQYNVPRSMLATNSYAGSPFQHVIETRTGFRRSLLHLDPAHDHPVLFELASAGGTDYLAIPMLYGDGSVQGGAFTTDDSAGFRPDDIATIEQIGPFLAAALEPAAMRRSMESLLKTYLGNDPAQRISNGAIRRGDQVEIEAAVLLTDLRGFTSLPEEQRFSRLGEYLEMIVEAVHAEQGDVLKFIGDGVLSIFPVKEGGRSNACFLAFRALARALKRAARTGEMSFVGCLNVGPVTYGNVGSLDRLDFTVVGPTVNFLSRLEMAAKDIDCPAVCSEGFAACLPTELTAPLGRFSLKGFPDQQAVFKLNMPDFDSA
ncbi:MAG: adenylate/guanylate cyclase domain-containing protein [Rhizobiaceae bacterium]|nr:adenylate/guanylate cyclase domain-containing protein [Rhizobiaceae bacterium]